jgi:hypothetical protein
MSKMSRLNLHCRRAFLIALLTCSKSVSGTTISVIVVPRGIVIAADGKTIQYTENERVPPVGRVSKKLRVVGHRMVVGSYGVAKIGSDPHPAYYLGSFFDDIGKEVGVKTTVSEAAKIIKERAALAMSGFNLLMSSGTVTRDTFVRETGHDNPLAGFVVAGYESGHPILFKVEVEIDWSTPRLRQPTITLLYPSATTEFSSDAERVCPLLPAWERCRIPKTGTAIQVTEIRARAIVDLGIEINGSNVGLPITSVTLFPNGAYRIRRYRSRLPDLCMIAQKIQRNQTRRDLPVGG